jgi:5-methyltetrahydrofolate corrinoid/iron sulfur protein methyltransferase
MTFLVEAAAGATGLPLFLDSANPKALAAGLKAGQSHPNPLIINGFSLEPKKLADILPLAAEYDADIIGYLLTPDSQVPVSEEDLMDTALALYQEFQKAGIPDPRLIIDPVVAPLIWENGAAHNRAVLSLLPRLPDLLGFPVRTMAGLSNLTTGTIPTDRKAVLETAFLPLLAGAGLSILLLNVFHADTLRAARAVHALLSPGVFSWLSI